MCQTWNWCLEPHKGGGVVALIIFVLWRKIGQAVGLRLELRLFHFRIFILKDHTLVLLYSLTYYTNISWASAEVNSIFYMIGLQFSIDKFQKSSIGLPRFFIKFSIKPTWHCVPVKGICVSHKCFSSSLGYSLFLRDLSISSAGKLSIF